MVLVSVGGHLTITLNHVGCLGHCQGLGPLFPQQATTAYRGANDSNEPQTVSSWRLGGSLSMVKTHARIGARMASWGGEIENFLKSVQF